MGTQTIGRTKKDTLLTSNSVEKIERGPAKSLYINFFRGILIFGGFALIYFLVTLFTGDIRICPFYNLTGHPCPSCGTTRALSALFHGEWATASYLNPNAFLIAGACLIFSIITLSDMLTRRKRKDLLLQKFLHFFSFKGETPHRVLILGIMGLLITFEGYIWIKNLLHNI